MIEVSVFRSDRQITAFELSGHADSGPYGYDIVCAGVSAVSFGTVNAVIELCGVELDIQQGTEGGYLHVVVPDNIKAALSEKIQLLLEGMIVSLKSIANEYNQFMVIQDK